MKIRLALTTTVLAIASFASGAIVFNMAKGSDNRGRDICNAISGTWVERTIPADNFNNKTMKFTMCETAPSGL